MGYRVPIFNLLMTTTLVVLVVLLAFLQYRWIGELSDAERDRVQKGLQSATTRFAMDFDREIVRVVIHFMPNPMIDVQDRRDGLMKRYREWEIVAPTPSIVKSMYYVHRDETGLCILEQYDLAASRFFPVEWPAELDSVHSRLDRPLRGDRPMGTGPDMPPDRSPFDIRALAVVCAFLGSQQHDHGDFGGPARNMPTGYVILQLNQEVISNVVLPALARRYFSSGSGLDYDLMVINDEKPPKVIYSSNPSVSRKDFGPPAASAGLIGMMDFGRLRMMMEARPPEGEGIGTPERPTQMDDRAPDLPPPGSRPDQWELIVRHRSGSLDTIVSAARLRNMVISVGILLLLSVSIVLLLVSAHRARVLALQRMEFVAGVTHELRTPLAVICSAGQNLADGVVIDTSVIRRYGNAIKMEGKRLSALVEQVLEYSEINSPAHTYTMEKIAVPALINAALAECQALIQESDIKVDEDIGDNLPEVMGDPAALQRALRNLVSNAVKYGGEARWIGISACVAGAGASREVRITVNDRGPGISPNDLPRIFEPFYRGKNAGSTIGGSGLGLSIVQGIMKAHHGKVRVDARQGGGCAFSLCLPTGGES